MEDKQRTGLIYRVSVRNHTPEGTFRALTEDLPEIRKLGTETLLLMPVNPVGKKRARGDWGNLDAPMDLRSVDPAYGTFEEFQQLIQEARRLGMKVVLTFSLYHAALDAVFVKDHPDFFRKNKDGNPESVAGRMDVRDLDFENRKLRNYLIEVMQNWSKVVDGFSVLQASMLPEIFWEELRTGVSKVNPDCLWIGETLPVETGNTLRRSGRTSLRDPELMNWVDWETDYETRTSFDRYLHGEIPLSGPVSLLNYQEAVYPADSRKMRFLEDAGLPRIAELIPNRRAREHFLAFLFFLKGRICLLDGEEYEEQEPLELSDSRRIARDEERTLSQRIQRLSEIRKNFSDDAFFAAICDDDRDTVVCERKEKDARWYGVFSFTGDSGRISLGPDPAPDGTWVNEISGNPVTIRSGRVIYGEEPLILRIPDPEA
ncbi:MAG: alpha-amylase family glycosyl hydrolase [Eubacteriales bacterium]|nr:alpha-amylase family glycosyl hydrolase [Eubacteriales bacterium]